MIIGNYARKSMNSDQSDSIENQMLLGNEYISKNYPDADVTYYIDEDKSGGDMFRPDWERLLHDMRNGRLDMVICYKLDRIGRDVGDLAMFYREIVNYNITVIPVRDNIEIKEDMTPTERGMMYMNAVFSQMERENTIVRVTDNMLKLAEKGYWCGGRPPVGCRLQKVVAENSRTHTVLIEDPETLPFFNRLVTDFLSPGTSLNILETRYKKEGFRTPLGSTLTSSQIWIILTNPTYTVADELTYNYFSALGCQMAKPKEAFDGSHGIMAYRRGRGSGKGSHKRKRILNPPEKWIITVGHHKPLLDSKTFLSIQKQFGKNVIDRTRKHKIGILKGVLRCSCGRLMRTKYKHDKKYDVEYQHYFCPARERMGVECCNSRFVHLNDLDDEVIQRLISISLDYTLIDNYISPAAVGPNMRKEGTVDREINAIQCKISNLTAALADSSDSSAAKYIISSIESLDKKIKSLKKERFEISLSNIKLKTHEVDKKNRFKEVCHIVKRLDYTDYDELNRLICRLFTECVWDGEKLHIKL